PGSVGPTPRASLPRRPGDPLEERLQVGLLEKAIAVDGVAAGGDLPLAVPIPQRAPRRTEEGRRLIVVWPLGVGHGHGRGGRTAAPFEGQGRPRWIGYREGSAHSRSRKESGRLPTLSLTRALVSP